MTRPHTGARAPDPPPPRNVEQLRRDIDTGRTGDKLDYGDPAAAPLGADEEAAGTPVRSEAVRTAGERETASGALHEQARAASTTATSEVTKSKTWIYVALAVATLVVLLLFGTMMTPSQ